MDKLKEYWTFDKLGRLIHVMRGKAYDARTHALIQLDGKTVYTDWEGNVRDEITGRILRTGGQMTRYAMNAFLEIQRHMKEALDGTKLV